MNLDLNLGRLETAELVRRVADLDLAYQFKHGLVQETGYSALLKNDRRALHLATAQALASCYPDALDENAALLAEHYHRAEDAENTILFAIRAGDRAMNLFAHPEARHFFGMAFELMGQREPNSENTRAYLDLALKYFFVSWARGASEHVVEQLRELAARARALATAAGGTPADRVRAMQVVGELGNALFARNEMAEALACFREILDAADAGTYDAASIANAAINTAGVLTVQGYFNRAEPLARQGYEIGKTMPVQWYWHGGLTFASLACAVRGNPHRALADLQWGLAEADATLNLPAASSLSIGLATIYRMIADWHTLLEVGEDAFARAERAREPIYQHLALSVCAHAASELGDLNRARELYDRARAMFEANEGSLFFADWTLATFAVTLFNMGELEEARQQAEQLIAVGPVLGTIYSEGLARRLRARILARTAPDDTPAIDADLQSALALFEQGDARLDMAHTRALWGALLRARGDDAGARTHLHQAAAQYRVSGLEALVESTDSYV